MQESHTTSGYSNQAESMSNQTFTFVPDDPTLAYPQVIRQYQDRNMIDKLVIFHVLPSNVKDAFVEVVNKGNTIKVEYFWPISIGHIEALEQKNQVK